MDAPFLYEMAGSKNFPAQRESQGRPGGSGILAFPRDSNDLSGPYWIKGTVLDGLRAISLVPVYRLRVGFHREIIVLRDGCNTNTSSGAEAALR